MLKIMIAIVEAVGEFDADGFAIEHYPLAKAILEEEDRKRKLIESRKKK